MMLAWGLLDVVYLAGFTAVILMANSAQAAPLSITDALIERFGLLTIIVLGETLTGVVNGAGPRADQWASPQRQAGRRRGRLRCLVDILRLRRAPPPRPEPLPSPMIMSGSTKSTAASAAARLRASSVASGVLSTTLMTAALQPPQGGYCA
jgi:hypothetical protein